MKASRTARLALNLAILALVVEAIAIIIFLLK